MHGLIKPNRATGLLTFNNVAEAYVLASLTRRFKLPLQRGRHALRFVGGEGRPRDLRRGDREGTPCERHRDHFAPDAADEAWIP